MALFTPETIILILASIVFLYYYLARKLNFWESRGVKGPKPILFFGTLLDVLRAKISLGRYLQNIYNEYQDEKMVGIFEGNAPALVLRDPDLIKDVLIKDFSVFPNRPVFLHEKNEPLSQHLFALDSSRWRPLRTKLSPIFTSSKLKSMFNVMMEYSEQFERYLETVVKKGEPIDSYDIVSRYAIDVIGICGFGLSIKAMAEENNDFRRMSKRIFRDELKIFLRLHVSKIPWLYNIIGRLFSDTDVEEFFIGLTTKTLEDRKRNNIFRDDVMDVLLAIKEQKKIGEFDVTDSLLAAQALVFFAAGFETVALTLSNAMYELALNHTVQDKLRQEIKEVLESTNGKITYECINEMKYLDLFIRETLRKYPPVMYLVRSSLTEYNFRGTNVTIPKKTKVFIPVYGIQNHPDVYPNPEVFDPERFTEEVVKSRHPMFFLPFGDGSRNCIGMRFAYNEAKIGIIKIVRGYLLDTCEKTPPPPYSINKQTEMLLHAARQLYVKLSPISTC